MFKYGIKIEFAIKEKKYEEFSKEIKQHPDITSDPNHSFEWWCAKDFKEERYVGVRIGLKPSQNKDISRIENILNFLSSNYKEDLWVPWDSHIKIYVYHPELIELVKGYQELKEKYVCRLGTFLFPTQYFLFAITTSESYGIGDNIPEEAGIYPGTWDKPERFIVNINNKYPEIEYLYTNPKTGRTMIYRSPTITFNFFKSVLDISYIKTYLSFSINLIKAIIDDNKWKLLENFLLSGVKQSDLELKYADEQKDKKLFENFIDLFLSDPEEKSIMIKLYDNYYIKKRKCETFQMYLWILSFRIYEVYSKKPELLYFLSEDFIINFLKANERIK